MEFGSFLYGAKYMISKYIALYILWSDAHSAILPSIPGTEGQRLDAHLDLQALTSCGEAEAAIEVAFDEAGRNLRDSFINGAKVPSMRLLQIRGPLPWGGLGPTSRGPREGEAFGPRRGFELACALTE